MARRERRRPGRAEVAARSLPCRGHGHLAGRQACRERQKQRPLANRAGIGLMVRRGAESAGFPLPLDLPPMEARLVDELPEEPGWQFEPKWDGFRCLAFRAGEEIELRAKSGKPLGRYFPEMLAVLRRLEPTSFVLDGELVIPVGETFSFDALQMRLHPAESRIKKLAAETPAVLILFDLLATPSGQSLLQTPLPQRREALDAFFDRSAPMTLCGFRPSLATSRKRGAG